MRYRLRNDFRLSIITLIGVFAAPAIAVMGVIRYQQGSTLGMALDGALVLFIIAVVVQAWRTEDTRVTGLVAALGTSAGAVGATMINGLDALLWLYPCLMSAFFLARPSEAFIISGTTVAVLVIFYDLASIVDPVPFVITAALLSICSYIYASRADKQQQRLKTLNFIDPLTGTRNRRAMDLELTSAIANFDRTGTGYALAMVDIDHFKSVNDRYGHAVGDSILIGLVDIMKSVIRPYDQIYRYGGEEFVILFSAVDIHSQQAVVAKLRQAVRTRLFTPSGQPVTISCGVVCLQPGMSREQWQKEADQAMYEAKASGRDAVVHCSDGAAPDPVTPG
ncbi:GGDEF domain-containing protein [Marinobacter sp. X15-166B]|uniref:GGDEF domain-containing protein n=1 Tax=Marinobacter sp. X15-166B TaxID=1897620 RepID=UPI00085C1DB9|nr:GGDEF domain-containing protein [Marinobacter sp. X15-166B]OEY66286.1 hypothetical protein BG841_07320 [Marinobacter sp. X15-166B]